MQEQQQQSTSERHMSLSSRVGVGAAALVAGGVVDVLAHGGWPGIVMSAAVAILAAKNSPLFYESIKEMLPQDLIEQLNRREPGGRSIMDRMFDRFPHARDEAPGEGPMTQPESEPRLDEPRHLCADEGVSRSEADSLLLFDEEQSTHVRKKSICVEGVLSLYQTGAISEKEALTQLLSLSGARGAPEVRVVEADRYPDLPPLSLFETLAQTEAVTGQKVHALGQYLGDVLNGFGVYVEVSPSATMIGPRILCFGVVPTGKPVMEETAQKRDSAGRPVYASRTRIEQITNREKDIQLALRAKTIRILPPVPGKHYVGIEIPNPSPCFVGIADVLREPSYRQAVQRSRLVFALGRDVAGHVQFCDLAKAPHVLIAGATGTGKSILLNVLIASLLTQATPDEVQLFMVDPKQVELTPYNGIAHLGAPVVTKVEDAPALLSNAITEMERRYAAFARLGVRNLEGYRKLRAARMASGDAALENVPAIVIIIDELADLMMMASDEVEKHICRLAQLARATGIHLVLATQRPSVDVITGLIKANIPTRIALTVSSAVDSRTILDKGGAERLLGQGDLLYLPPDEAEPIRIQGAFMTDKDALALSSYWQGKGDMEGFERAQRLQARETDALPILRPPQDGTQNDCAARDDGTMQFSVPAQNGQEMATFARNDRVQKEALRPHVDTTQPIQKDVAPKYRLTDAQIKMFCSIYPDPIRNKDDALKKVGANSAYRAHANEIIKQYNLIRKGGK